MSTEIVNYIMKNVEGEHLQRGKQKTTSVEVTDTVTGVTEKVECSKRVVLIEIQGESEIGYRPELVNKKADTDIPEFVIEETKRFKERLHELRTIDPMGAHGRRRPKKEISSIRKQRETEIRQEQLEEKLAVLKGDIIKPIRLVKDGKKIVGFELVDFASKEQKRWWMFLDVKSQLTRVAELAQTYLPGTALLEEAFNIRYKKVYGYPEEMDQAEQDFKDFSRKTRSIPNEYDPLFIPLFRMISEHFSR